MNFVIPPPSRQLWDLRAGKMMTQFHGHVGPVTDLQFHPQ